MSRRRAAAPAAARQRLADVLFSQGFGTRRACAARIAAGSVQIDGKPIDDPDALVDTDGLVLTVDAVDWPFHARALVMLNKPAGTECSQRPGRHPSVLGLLPEPLRVRGVQPVGRLDADTTGLLLLTDDGALLHRLTSPRHHVPKVYRVATAEPVTTAQIDRLLAGVALHGESRTAQARACVPLAAHQGPGVRLTITEGRYHQVKRMLAAVGQPVVALHRESIGALDLPADLAPGAWRWLTPADVAALGHGADGSATGCPAPAGPTGAQAKQ